MSEKQTQQKEVKENKEVKSKTSKKENVKTEEFKKITDLTDDEIKNLPRISAIIRKRENKRSKNIFYEIEVRFNEYLKMKTNLTETRFNLMKLKLGLDFSKAEETLRVPVRLVKGLRKDDSEYHQVELILGKDVYETDIFFKSDELELLQLTIPNIKFEVRPEKINNLDLDGFEQ